MPAKGTTGKVTFKEKLAARARAKLQGARKWGSAAQKAALEKARKASARARRAAVQSVGGNTAILRRKMQVKKAVGTVKAAGSSVAAVAKNRIRKSASAATQKLSTSARRAAGKIEAKGGVGAKVIKKAGLSQRSTSGPSRRGGNRGTKTERGLARYLRRLRKNN